MFDSSKLLMTIASILFLPTLCFSMQQTRADQYFQKFVSAIKIEIETKVMQAETDKFLDEDDENSVRIPLTFYIADEFNELRQFPGLTSDDIKALLADQIFIAWLEMYVKGDANVHGAILRLLEEKLNAQVAEKKEVRHEVARSSQVNNQLRQEHLSTPASSSSTMYDMAMPREPSPMLLGTSTQSVSALAQVARYASVATTTTRSVETQTEYVPLDQRMISERKEERPVSVTTTQEESFPLFRLERRPGSAFSQVASRITPSSRTGTPHSGTVSYSDMLRTSDYSDTIADRIMLTAYATASMARTPVPFRSDVHSAFARSGSSSAAAASTSSASAASYAASDTSTAPVLMDTSDQGSEHKQAESITGATSGASQQTQALSSSQVQPAVVARALQAQAAPARVIIRVARRQYHDRNNENDPYIAPKTKEKIDTSRPERDDLRSSFRYVRAYYFVKQIMRVFDHVASLRYGQEYPEHDRLENKLIDLFLPHNQLAGSTHQLIEIIIKVAVELEEDSVQFGSGVRQHLQQLFMGQFVQDLINVGFLPGTRVADDIKESAPSPRTTQKQQKKSGASCACDPRMIKYYYR